MRRRSLAQLYSKGQTVITTTKAPRFTGLAAIGALMALALAILACGGGDANSGSTTTGGNSTGSSQQQHFKVGDQVKVGDTFVVTVNSVKTSKGDQFIKPKSGNTFLVVDVTIKNASKSEQNISSLLNFEIKDSAGQKYTETILSDVTPPDGKIEAGGLLKGQMPYEVSSSQHDFVFSFQADITSSGQTIWDLHV
jgi:F0F1-type ATP synthase membrane subunit c/vacuolar-type H+-ATPase subunit K